MLKANQLCATALAGPVLLVVPLALASCGGVAEVGPSEVGSTDRGLFGDVTIDPSCEALGADGKPIYDVDAFRAGVEWLRGRVLSDEYRECLADAFVTSALGASPEDIVRASATALGVTLECGSCGDVGAACAGSIPDDGSPERITFTASALTLPPETVGSILLHEIMHNHGFSHPFGYWDETVPEVVQDCIVEGHPRSWSRSTLHGLVATAKMASATGALTHEARCAAGRYASGMVVGLDPTSRRPSSIGLWCSEVLPTGTGNSIWQAGDFSVPAFAPSSSCAPGELMIGAHGHAQIGGGLLSIASTCAPLSELRSADTIAPRFVTPRLGLYTWPMQDARRACPTHKAVVGVRATRATASAPFDSLEVLCDDLPESHFAPAPALTAGVGTLGGQAFTRACQGAGVLIGLYGAMLDGHVGALAGKCAPMIGDVLMAWRSYQTELAGELDVLGRSWLQLQAVTRQESAPFTACALGGTIARRGLDTNRNHVLDAAEVTGTRTLCDRAILSPTVFGRITGIRRAKARVVFATPDRCPYGGNAVWLGFDDDGSGTLDRGEVVYDDAACHAGDGTCPDDEVMVGVTGRVDTRIRSIAPLCSRYTDWATTTTAPHPAPDIDLGTAGTAFERRCARGQVAVGLSGRGTGDIGTLQVACAQPTPGVPLERIEPSIGTFSNASYPPRPRRCPDRSPLVGFETDLDGDTLLGVAPLCSRPTPTGIAGPGYELPTLGDVGHGPLQVRDRCPAGQALVGLLGRASVLVEGIVGVCADPVTWKGSGVAPLTPLTYRGSSNAGYPSFVRYCPRGKMLLGLSAPDAVFGNVSLLCGASGPE